MSSETVVGSREGDGLFLEIAINRPRARNALTPEVVTLINAQLDEAISTSGIRTIVLTGRGEHFCAGADLKFVRERLSEDDLESLVDFVAQIAQLADRLERTPKPIIAAVSGYAVAGGLELLLACDLTIATVDARIGDGHAKYGLLPGAGSTLRLPRKIGESAARELLFTGDLIDGRRAEQLGLVNRAVERDDFGESVREMTRKLGSASPRGLRRIKDLVTAGIGSHHSAHSLAESLATEAHLHSPDMMEGLRAFNESRSPDFGDEN